ncbi:threonine aldolase [Dulcicalothrix desertica PCC 7102]|uniref:Threonine aldolase n=1 Tax=Dulcicalothrix desertica PCC 7102 TaxID=232991 RepID=A0A3S1J786_9CYAN|nr:threonine aldolase family protein [Dulcicalothrix desertica]RUT09030.1 threonine aldolase [Dulcicalothrix desertica PCC 7102]TWH49906.1 L-threonine aldolase [Dulcicalothrix desertica PCC 7102]
MILLGSDTETKPTRAMRQAIANAEVGDEQKGEDPTVNKLLERVADLLGKEAALFFACGTICNFVAIKTHTRPADVVLAEHMSHIIRAESGGAALSSGVLMEPIASERGIFTVNAIEQALARVTTAPYLYCAMPRLLCVEQTHNFSGGNVWQLSELQSVCEFSRQKGLATHMDGARLLNAVVASGTSAKNFSSCVDSVWIDFTKGLGAPMGAVLAGSREFISEARRYKHIFGGAMRQAGIIAAGCLHALDYHVERLIEDHDNATYLARSLSTIEGVKVRDTNPDTNIVFFDVSQLGIDKGMFLNLLQQHGVKMGRVGQSIRAVTHLDVSRADIDFVVDTVASLVKFLGSAAIKAERKDILQLENVIQFIPA